MKCLSIKDDFSITQFTDIDIPLITKKKLNNKFSLNNLILYNT